MENKIRMYNSNPKHQKYGRVEFFTEAVANSAIVARDGWVRQELPESVVAEIEELKQTEGYQEETFEANSGEEKEEYLSAGPKIKSNPYIKLPKSDKPKVVKKAAPKAKGKAAPKKSQSNKK